MFQEWGFLIGELMTLLLLAALVGLLAGWLFFGGRRAAPQPAQNGAEAARLALDLEACRNARADLDARVAALREDLETARAERDAARREVADARREAELAEAETRRLEAEARREAAAEAARAALASDRGKDGPSHDATEATPQDPPGGDLLPRDYDRDGVIEGADEGEKPETLAGPRDGTPDDLKEIRGIGVKLEALCHRLGIFHFDQIAGWTQQEIAWVDANLEGFKGRVSRDHWVEQARRLMEKR